MNEHAGPACALSGLIVGFFAFLLHDHIPVATVSRPTGREQVVAGAFEIAPVASPPPPVPSRASSPRAPATVSRPVKPATPNPRLVPNLPPPAAAPLKERNRGHIGRVLDSKQPSLPRSAFAMAAEGESLAEVAERVYGSRQLAEALWKANRDQVERVDSSLTVGTLLRTP